jgi:prepilin-type N-terminal cleavage/methylation domain-containing protein
MEDDPDRMIDRAPTLKRELARFQYGFSLVELAVVVFIVGIILTMGVGALSAARENTAVSATTQKQNAIKEALIGYLRRNSRLPCPDTNFTAPDGVENRATAGDPTTSCTNKFGVLPYVALGLGREAVQDGWGNFFSYQVANAPGANTDWTISTSFRTGNTGNVTVNDRVGGERDERDPERDAPYCR